MVFWRYLQTEMAASRAETPDDNELDAELRSLETEIGELRSAKREVLERARPFTEQLATIARRERECVNKVHRLTAEKHDRETQRRNAQRVIEMESEIGQLRHENEALRSENAARTEISGKLRRSLAQTTKHSKLQMRKIGELTEELAAERQMRSSENMECGSVLELRKWLIQTTKLLSETREELNETRRRLSHVQERLTVAEQVTAATQQRELQESGVNSEQLQLELTQQHLPTTNTGAVFFLIRN